MTCRCMGKKPNTRKLGEKPNTRRLGLCKDGWGRSQTLGGWDYVMMDGENPITTKLGLCKDGWEIGLSQTALIMNML